MAVSEIPLGGYTNLTNSTSAGAKTEIVAQIAKLTALIPNTAMPGAQTTSPAGALPGWDKISPEICAWLRLELTALAACVTNGA